MVIVALLIAWVAGCAAVRALKVPLSPCTLFAALPIGIGVTSLPVALWHLLGWRLGARYAALDASLVAIAVVLILSRRGVELAAWRLSSRFSVGVLALVVVTGAVAYRWLGGYLDLPCGDWDAWAIWNLQARVLFHGGELFAPGRMGHPEYPLLLPSAVARLWAYAGETTAAPALLGVVFGAAGAAAVGAILWETRGQAAGVCGAFCVLAAPIWILSANSQYADEGVAAFFVVALSLLAVGDREPRLVYLAGLAAGLGAWTKDEGAMLLAAVLLARWVGTARGGWRPCARETARLLAGTSLPLAMLCAFKASAPPSALLQTGGVVSKIIDPARHALVAAAFWDDSPFDLWAAMSLGATAVLLRSRPIPWMVVAVAVAVAGFYVVYLITPYDLEWHLHSSAARVLAQVWPALVLAMLGASIGERRSVPVAPVRL